MAPSTALLFVLYGIAAFLRAPSPLSAGAYWMGVAVNSAGALVALLLFVLSFLGKLLAAEHLGFPVAGTVGEAPVGHISQVTAICFMLASLSFLTSLPSSSSRPWRARVAWWTAGVLLATCSVLLLAYLYGTPLLYGGSFIPPAATTSLAFAALGTALLALAGLQAWPQGDLAGPDPRASYPLVLAFVLLALGIVTVGGLYYRDYGKRYRAEVAQQLSAIAALQVGELVQYRQERLADGSIFFRNAAFSALVRRALDHPNDRAAHTELRTWLRKYHEQYQYDRVFLLDARGAERMAAPEVPAPVASVIARRVPEILESGEAAFQDFYRDEHDQKVYLTVLVPILDGPDRRGALGILGLRIDPETYLYPFLRRWPTPSRTAETLLIRRDGNDALFLNEPRFQEHTAFGLRIPLASEDVPAVKAALGQEGIVEGRDYRGVPVVAALRVVPGSPWHLVARMDVAEVNAPLWERLWATVVLVGVLLAGAGAGLGLVWRQQRVRFYQEKYQTEKALGESRALLEAIVNATPDSIFAKDPQGRYLLLNAAVERFTGKSQAATLGQDDTFLFPPAEAAAIMEADRKMMDAEGPTTFEQDLTDADGTGRTLLTTKGPLFDASGALIGLFGVTRDITERKRSETRIRHLNRVYAVLSDINQAIVRLREPQALFAEACRIAVELGGFRLAWVGLLDPEAKTVRPVAHAGVTDGYLETLPIVSGGEPRGLGPVASALREGQHMICNDIEHDSRMAPWRDDALARGYRALAILPLTVDGETRGTFNLYAGEAGFFDSEEVRLLDELVMDLSFAIEMSQREAERQRAEAALRASEARYRAVARTANDAIVTADSTGNIVGWNQGAQVVFGYTDAEVSGQPLTMLMPQRFRDRYLDGVKRVQAGGEGRLIGTTAEVAGLRKDGGEFPLEVSLAEWETAEGRFYTGILRDITERKRSEERHRLQSAALAAAANAIVLTDRDARIEWANEAFTALTGYPLEEAAGRNLRELIRSGQHDRAFYKAMWDTILAGRVWHGEIVNRRKDGTLYEEEMTITPIRDEAGAITHFVAIKQDVTDRNRVEAALHESERHFRALIENALDVTVVLGPDECFRYASPSIQRISGDRPADLVGTNALDRLHPDDLPAARRLLSAGAEVPGFTASMEFRFRHRDGSWLSFEAIVRNLLHDPAVNGIIVNARDVTERRQVEAQQRRLQAQLAQSEKLAAMGQLLAGVAHELNNPLSIVIGHTALLRRTTDAAIAPRAQKIGTAAERCGRIVKNFLALARQHEPERQTMELNQVVRDVVELLAYHLRVDDVEAVVTLAADLPPISADPHQLQQVVVNLVTNGHQAMRHAPRPRRFTLTTRRAAGADRVCLEVEDTGPGITPEVEAHLFEPFFTTKPVGQGTGLGLSICKGIVESHGGTIAVEGRPGRGARFTIELPISASAPTAVAADHEVPPPRGIAILVVDDEMEVAQLMAEMVAGEDCRVATAGNGREALDVLARETFDVVIIDLKMPAMDGMDLYREIAQRYPALRGRVVFVTGDTLSPLTAEFLQETGAPGVRKPFSATDLRSAVHAVRGGSPPAEPPIGEATRPG
jgi:nitrogen fixation negative regulator NifL